MTGRIADQETVGEHATPPRISETQVPLVAAQNGREGFMDYSQTEWVLIETAHVARDYCRPQVGGHIPVCVGETTVRLTVLREPRNMVLVKSVAYTWPDSDVLDEFFERAIRSPVVVQPQTSASVKAAAQPQFYGSCTRSLLIPLPPLAEQHRIVAKVNLPMTFCDQLEPSLTRITGRLLDALLAEALAPAAETLRTAAE